MIITLTNEAAKTLAEVSGVKGASVVLDFALKMVEDKAINTITAVNGGVMETLTFTSTAPKAEELIKSVVLTADTFLSAVSALSVYNADIKMEVTEAKVTLSVGSQAKISVPVVTEKPKLLPQDTSVQCARIGVKSEELSKLLKGFAVTAADPKEITDRISFMVTEKGITAYTTDGISVSKLCVNGAQIQIDAFGMAVRYLLLQGMGMSDEDKKALQGKLGGFMQNKDTEGMILYATECGMPEEKKLAFTLPTISAGIMASILKGTETAMVLVTPNFLYVKAGNMTGTFAIGKKVPSIYSNVDKWEDTPYQAVFTVDQAELARAITVLKSTQPGQKLNLKGAKASIKVSAGEGAISVKLVGGDANNCNLFLAADRALGATSMLCAGNITLGVMPNAPVQFTNGDGSSTHSSSAHVYVLPIKDNTPAKKEDEDASEE